MLRLYTVVRDNDEDLTVRAEGYYVEHPYVHFYVGDEENCDLVATFADAQWSYVTRQNEE